MTLKEAEQLLDHFLNNTLESLGFKHAESLEYVRIINEAVAQLSFPCRLTAYGFAAFTCCIGIRFEAMSKWLDEDPSEMRSTAGKPIHFLREDTSYTEWEFTNADDLEKLREMLLDDLKKHALPYIERYSRLADLRKTLESPNKEDWFSTGLNVDSRVTVLAAIQFVQGERDSAIATLNEGLENLKESLADKPYELRKRQLRKRGFNMEYLRDRLMAEK